MSEVARNWLGRDTGEFSKDVIVLYFGRGVGHTKIHICENSGNCVLNMWLYANYSWITGEKKPKLMGRMHVENDNIDSPLVWEGIKRNIRRDWGRIVLKQCGKLVHTNIKKEQERGRR